MSRPHYTGMGRLVIVDREMGKLVIVDRKEEKKMKCGTKLGEKEKRGVMTSVWRGGARITCRYWADP